MFVPWSSGELFATLTANKKKVHIIHADLNAAQNLQRRFWGRCGEAFRISCRRTGEGGKDVYVLAKEPGLRLLGALQQLVNGAATFRLVPDRSGQPKRDRYVMEPTDGKKIKLEATDDDISTEDDELVDVITELEENSGGLETFFRDPSGSLFNSRNWIPSKKYWSIVKQRIWEAMTPKDNPKVVEGPR